VVEFAVRESGVVIASLGQTRAYTGRRLQTSKTTDSTSFPHTQFTQEKPRKTSLFTEPKTRTTSAWTFWARPLWRFEVCKYYRAPQTAPPPLFISFTAWLMSCFLDNRPLAPPPRRVRGFCSVSRMLQSQTRTDRRGKATHVRKRCRKRSNQATGKNTHRATTTRATTKETADNLQKEQTESKRERARTCCPPWPCCSWCVGGGAPS
jgi:hypothetical protein